MKSIWLQIVSPTLYLGLLLGLAPLSLGAYQDPETEAEARAAIEAINREIATLEELITSQSAARDALQRQLRKTDLDIGRTNNVLRKTQENLDKRQRQINTLEAQGIATSSTMPPNGFWNSTVARAFPGRAITPAGWSKKKNVWPRNPSLKLHA